MNLVETHIINKKRYKDIFNIFDNNLFLSKNLYNYVNYIVRQEFIINGNYKSPLGFSKEIKEIDCYTALPRKVSNQVLFQVDRAWKGFFSAIKDWKVNPHKYLAKPEIPGYKHKTKGRNVLVYELQAISSKLLRDNKIKLSKIDYEIELINKNVKVLQVRLIPINKENVKIEIVYDKEEKERVKTGKKLAIDYGINNLMTITSNIKGYEPILVNGKPLKSNNQFYNKKLAKLKSELPSKKLSSNAIRKLTHKRNNKVKDYLHKASKFLIDLAIDNNIDEIIIGKNVFWKQEINIGKQNNQNFVQIPFNQSTDYIAYKAKLNGIKVTLQEESYTSKASFLSLDKIPVYNEEKTEDHKFSGYRKSRGLYKDKPTGKTINADVNGSYNILRKAVPKVFSDGIEGFAVNPKRVKSFK